MAVACRQLLPKRDLLDVGKYPTYYFGVIAQDVVLLFGLPPASKMLRVSEQISRVDERFRSFLRLAASCLGCALCLALAACGGGGGGSSAVSPPTPPVMATATLSVFAGTAGGMNTTDGTGVDARFYYPTFITADSSGNLYVTQGNDYTVRKITTAGVVTTFAGVSGTPGFANGTGSAARFINPAGVVADAAGNVYVGDYLSVRKITPAGVVTTLAGGTAGTADGTGPAAQFSSLSGLAIDGNGNIYAVDYVGSGASIRKITPAGAVSTLFANLNSFNEFGAIASDQAGNLYTIWGDRTIRALNSAGTWSVLAGSAQNYPTSVDGIGAAAGFANPAGLMVGAGGNLFVVDNDAIRMVTLAGVVTTIAGTPGATGTVDGTGAAALFNFPTGIAAGAGGIMYVADRQNGTIRQVTVSGVVTTLAGLAPSLGSTDGAGSAAQFNNPMGIAANAGGNLFVADNGNATIRKITPGALVSTLAGTAGKNASQYGTASSDGVGAAATFCGPNGVAVDANDNVFVADDCGTIRKVDASANVTTIAGRAFNLGSNDGTGAAAQFYDPQGIAVDAMGNLYVTDVQYSGPSGGPFGGPVFPLGSAIRRIASGVVNTIAGTDSKLGSADGTGAAALFNAPVGVATDLQGNVYVADKLNCAIRKINPNGMTTSVLGATVPAGIVTTFAGVSGQCGSVDGPPAAARFAAPNGIAIDSQGNLYVVDGMSTIRKVAPDGTTSTVWGVGGQSGLQLATQPGTFFPAYGVAVVNDKNLAITTSSNVLMLTLP